MSDATLVDSTASTELPAFDFVPLGQLVFGRGSLARLGAIVRELGGQRVLLVTDPGLEAAGHLERARQFLEEAGLAVAVFDGVEENPETRHVRAGVAAAVQHQADFLVALGGGSAMDCAKGINFLLTNGGTMSDYRGFGKATRPMLPSVGIPTTAGTGSEAQSYALIADDSTHLKMACGDRKAAFRVSILDPELTITAPPLVTAVTGLDALTHAVESYVSTRRNPVSQAYSLAAWRLLEPNFPKVLADPTDVTARANMQLGAYLAGMAIEASMLGAAHACANPLTAHYGITHGLAVAILLPHVIRFNAAVVEPLYAQLIHCSGSGNGEPPVEALARRIEALVRLADLPTRLSQCGVSREILAVLAEEANQQWTARFNPRSVQESDLLRLYEGAW